MQVRTMKMCGGRAGRVRTTVLSVSAFAALVAIVALVFWQSRPGPEAKEEPLLVYCGAGIKAPVEAAANQYEEEYGVPVRLQFGPSQTLLTQARVSSKGDLFLPGDDSYVQLARQDELVGQTFPLAHMAVVLAVRHGNPKGIRSLDNLLFPDVIIGQAEPAAAAAGKLARDALRKAGAWERVRERTTVFMGTVGDVATALRLGSIDAGFIWDVLVKQTPGLEVVPLPELATARAQVTVAVLKSSSRPEAAAHFARYLAANDKGLKAFKEEGFTPVDGVDWPRTPLPR